MTDPGAQNYVYAEIENCIGEMRTFTQNITQQAQELTSQVKQLISNGQWQGYAADRYSERAGTLTQKLQAASQQIQQTQQAVDTAQQNMQAGDKKGGSQVGGH